MLTHEMCVSHFERRYYNIHVRYARIDGGVWSCFVLMAILFLLARTVKYSHPQPDRHIFIIYLFIYVNTILKQYIKMKSLLILIRLFPMRRRFFYRVITILHLFKSPYQFKNNFVSKYKLDDHIRHAEQNGDVNITGRHEVGNVNCAMIDQSY